MSTEQENSTEHNPNPAPAAAATPRKQKTPQPFFIGHWKDGVFTCLPLAQQPPETVTTVQDLVAFAKEALKDEPGDYEFVRAIPGKLRIAKQEVFKASFGA